MTSFDRLKKAGGSVEREAHGAAVISSPKRNGAPTQDGVRCAAYRRKAKFHLFKFLLGVWMESLGWSQKYMSAIVPWREKNLSAARRQTLPIYGRIIYEETLGIPPALTKIRCQGKKLKRVLIELVDMAVYRAGVAAKERERERQRIEIEEGKRQTFTLHYSKKRRRLSSTHSTLLKVATNSSSDSQTPPTSLCPAPIINAQFFIAYSAVHSQVGSFVRLDLLSDCVERLKMVGQSKEARHHVRKLCDGIMDMSVPQESAIKTFIKNNVSERISVEDGVASETAEIFRLFNRNLFELHTMKSVTRRTLYNNLREPEKLIELCLDASPFGITPLALGRLESWAVENGWCNGRVGAIKPEIVQSAIDLMQFIDQYVKKRNCDIVSSEAIPIEYHSGMEIVYRMKKLAYNRRFRLFYPRRSFTLIVQCIQYLKRLSSMNNTPDSIVCCCPYPYSSSFVSKYFNDLEALSKGNAQTVFIDAFTWIERGSMDGVHGLDMMFSAMKHREIYMICFTRAHFLRLIELKYFLKTLHRYQIRFSKLTFMFDSKFQHATVELLLDHYAKCGGSIEKIEIDFLPEEVSIFQDKVDIDMYFILSAGGGRNGVDEKPLLSTVKSSSDSDNPTASPNLPLTNSVELFTILNSEAPRTVEQSQRLFSVMYSTLDALICSLESIDASPPPPPPLNVNRFINCTFEELLKIFHRIRKYGKTIIITFDEEKKLHYESLVFAHLEAEQLLNRVKAEMYSNFQYMDLKNGQLGKFFRLTEADRRQELKVHRHHHSTDSPNELPCHETQSCCLDIFQREQNDGDGLPSQTSPRAISLSTDNTIKKNKKKKHSHEKRKKLHKHDKNKRKEKKKEKLDKPISNWWFTTNVRNPYNRFNVFRFKDIESRLVPAEVLANYELHCEVDFLILLVDGGSYAKANVLPHDIYRTISFAKKHVIFATV